MLLPSVAISIAIHYLGMLPAPAPDNTIAAIVVCLPSVLMGALLWWQGFKGKGERDSRST